MGIGHDMGRIQQMIIRRVAASGATPSGAPKPSPAVRAAPSARRSHHSPNPSMTTDAMMPRPGAANGVVPKKGMGIAFWSAGVPGRAGHGEGRRAERDRGRHQALCDVRRLEQGAGHRREDEEGDEQADAAVGHERTSQHDREHGAARAQPLGHEAGDRLHRAAVVHELAENSAEQEQRKELRQEAGRATHEGLGPMGEQRLPCGGSCEQGRSWGQQQHAPAAKSQPDEQRQTEQDAKEAHRVSRFAVILRGRRCPGGDGLSTHR